ncbi:MAG: YedE family putative selenium transporter [bacterium]|nr:YedE-related selenium metabolism membrane protein [bacterium]MBU1291121.1 YedE-related selenium metabolism membrane protein [bacterium]MBU1428156.1 YedE-related selenium metabolism membrane protein [bacterium]
MLKKIFCFRKYIIFTGVFIGISATVLQKLGNPANMGICIACMERDIAGALGLHRAAVVQYIRPEIIGFVFGSLIAALIFKEFKARSGSAPLMRFVLGFLAMIGALVFLGCPWRTLLRLAGGDGNALFGLAGLITGILVGIFFIKSGYNLGRNQRTYPLVGWIMPLIMMGLFLLLLFRPQLPSGAVFFSSQGPGSQHAPLFIALLVAMVIGFLAQRTRFCTVAAVRDVILIKDTYLFTGVISLLLAALVSNLILKQFHPGFQGQPIAHTNQLWNFGGMVLAGLAFTLAGGCPGRQLFLSGEGDADAAVFVLGMIVGAGFAHNFDTASSPQGPGLWGPASVIVGLIICLIIGFSMSDLMKKKKEA